MVGPHALYDAHSDVRRLGDRLHDVRHWPATLGGGVIGLIFQRLAYHRRLDVGITVVIGALFGLIEGSVIDWIVAPIPLSGQGWFPDLPHGLLYNGAISVISGLFVSMILYIWFERKMR